MLIEGLSIPLFDHHSANQARSRQDHLLKPAGSLGRLEEISIQMAGIQGTPMPHVEKKSVVIMAADHGVCEEGVSAFSATTTHQMVSAFLAGKAAINVLAQQAEVAVSLVDIGVACDLQPAEQLFIHKIAKGTANITQQPAMTEVQVLAAIQVGKDVARREAEQGVQLIAIGEMGIGKTTPSSAIISVITGLPVNAVTGRGSGVDNCGLHRKMAAIEKAIEINQPDPADPLDVLMKVGGLEIAGLVGLILGAAHHRIGVMIDGLIAAAAALVAYELQPALRMYFFAGHKSTEPGQHAVFDRIGIKPILDLQMHLGEGTGAVLAMNIVDVACQLLCEMGTFSEMEVENGR